MCTISAVNCSSSFVITFNRDEQPGRAATDYLQRLDINDKQVVYARDPKAGGSWFAADSKGHTIVLFNGGFDPHQKRDNWHRSRGIILLETIAATSPLGYIQELPLIDIEPFSMLLHQPEKLYRFTWTGKEKILHALDRNQPAIFSSATLYSKQVQDQRAQWLEKFIQDNVPEPESLFMFHSNYNSADSENGLVINRKGGCKTISISQAVITTSSIHLSHWDWNTKEKKKTTIRF